MIRSMTAFGRAQKEELGYSAMLEVRTLNGRNLDIVLRLPKNFLEFEEAFRKQIAQSIRRGRVEVFVQISSTRAEEKAPRLNIPLARFYWEQLLELHRQLPGTSSPTLEDLLRIPYLFEMQEAEVDREALGGLLTGLLSDVMEQINAMRGREGEALFLDCMERMGNLRREVSVIESRKDVVVEEHQTRLRDRITELLGNIELDENRLLQEVACFAERSDINEEIVRLKSHFDQVEKLLSDPKGCDGRKLDFLAQELHRETNTIGCKTGDLELVQTVVRMKSEIGKLKEQVQNIE